MKRNILKVTIGIPAYNEVNNIVPLIKDILNQKTSFFQIIQIIISSDGSSDETAHIIRKLKNKKIKIIDNKKREGVARGLNQIIAMTKGDILVTLDADIRIFDRYFIKKIIKPVSDNSADLVSSAIVEFTPKNFFSKTIFVSMKLKTILFFSFNNGQNIYTCHGQTRAYSKRFFKKLHFPVSIGNDMYSYFACLSMKYNYRYISNAKVTYKLPDNLEDHYKQSARFFAAGKEQTKLFDKNFVKSQIKIPFSVYFVAFFRSLPLLIGYFPYVLSYLIIRFLLKFKYSTFPQKQVWDIAVSSKSI